MSEFLFSTARKVISPKVPVSLAGYFNIRMWTKILDDIEVRVLAMRQNGKDFLLVQCDLLTINDEVYQRVLDGIKSLKIYTEKNILFTATHTHTAPICRNESGICGSNGKYTDFLVKQIVAAIKEAAKGPFRKGELAVSMAMDDRFIFNRRYWMADGTVLTNPGRFNPKTVEPEGVIDPEITIAAILSEGRVEVVLANIVNHTDTTDGCEVSADWAGWTRRKLEEQMDGEAPMMFPLIGASGNINHFDVNADFNQSCPAEAKRIGTGYAATIANALKDLQFMPDFEMKSVFKEVLCEKAEVDPKDLAEAKKILKKYKNVPDPADSDVSVTSEDLAQKKPIALKMFAAALVKHAESDLKFRFRLTGVSFGPLVIASLPSEPFVEIGLDIRKRFFGNRLCMVVSHGNGTGNPVNYGGYIPNYWNFNRGGYETEISSNPFERHTAGKLREAWADIAIQNLL